ncbi:Domain of Uncharacterised Function (DUF1599) [[Flavobacterium] thermophilum]|nr:Domain of Uncharacterised Function (DUF1599) [[Flavobacterium] thermophilum]
MKFKKGDKVKVISNDSYNEMEGNIVDVNPKGKDYLVFINDDEIIWFDEHELELIDNNTIINNSNIELHKKILDEIHDTYKRKNADYGNSFEEQFKEYGLLSAIIRLDDKMRRLKQLLKNKAQVKDESIEDTLIDLAGYAILTLMELNKDEVYEKR